MSVIRPVLEGAIGDIADTRTVTDTLGRSLRDLRVSVTDRCNFRCTYCMPKEVFGRGYQFLPQERLLTFEEITRLARIFITHGVQKVRITGGEPLLRRDIERLIEMLVALDGLQDLSLTTNGSLLAKKAAGLKKAGLRRVTVSLDSLDNAVFKAMNDVDFPVEGVLEGIEAARAAALSPIKINMVVKRGVNDGDVLPMARHFHGTGCILRFIEYMDVAEGQLYTCLFAATGHNLRDLLREDRSDEEISTAVRDIWSGRSDRYSEIRTSQTALRSKVEMSHVGG